MTSRNNNQILIVDDDVGYCRLIEKYLKREGYLTATAHDAASMRAKLDVVSLVLLDLHLGQSNGIELAREIRQSHNNLGIIMVTASTDEINRIVGLEVGADDYVCKPFNERELVARIRSVMRRLEYVEPEGVQAQLKFLDFVIDLEARQLYKDNEPIDLTGHEFNLLVMLAKRPNRVFTREEISQTISAREWYPNDRSVDVLVSKLRKKLERGSESDVIRSLRGVGYQFAAKVEKT